jgi:hypothetical protein
MLWRLSSDFERLRKREGIVQLHAEVAQARRLADALYSPQAREELRQMAASLEYEACKLEEAARRNEE